MAQALLTGVSGLKNHQEWLDVIGNNISNANTPGFKSSNVVFEDVLSQTLSSGSAPSASQGGTSPMQVGLGVRVGAIAPSLTQGSIQTTGRNTDLAIQGDGFFVLSDGTDRLFTRAGAFTLDANGDLVDGATGFKVQGAGGDIRINQGQESTPQTTTEALFKGNLDASAADGTAYVATLDVRDSLGSPHTLTLTFAKNFAAAPGQWDWTVTTSDASVTGLTTATGSLVFDTAGAVSSGATQAVGITYAAGTGAATPQPVTLDFGSAASTTPLTGLAGASTATLATQDGHAAGTLQSFAVGLDGVVTGFFDNGTTAVLDTVQLATFNNPAGLLKIGSNQFRESADSGIATVGAPRTGGRGTLVSSALENSNVDLAQEFANMILAQRGFQANARTVSTANELLEEIVNLKR